MGASEPGNPWERRSKGESETAYAYFVAYRDLGPGRSLARVRQSATEALPKIEQLKRLSSRHAWVERAAAWDAHLQAEKDRVAEERAIRWAEREHDDMEAVYAMGEKLRKKALRALKLPLVEVRKRTSKDGQRSITVIRPLKFGLRDLAAVMATSAGLTRGSIEAAKAMRKPGEAPAEADGSTLTPEQVEAMVIAGHRAGMTPEERADFDEDFGTGD